MAGMVLKLSFLGMKLFEGVSRTSVVAPVCCSLSYLHTDPFFRVFFCLNKGV